MQLRENFNTQLYLLYLYEHNIRWQRDLAAVGVKDFAGEKTEIISSYKTMLLASPAKCAQLEKYDFAYSLSLPPSISILQYAFRRDPAAAQGIKFTAMGNAISHNRPSIAWLDLLKPIVDVHVGQRCLYQDFISAYAQYKIPLLGAYISRKKFENYTSMVDGLYETRNTFSSGNSNRGKATGHTRWNRLKAILPETIFQNLFCTIATQDITRDYFVQCLLHAYRSAQQSSSSSAGATVTVQDEKTASQPDPSIMVQEDSAVDTGSRCNSPGGSEGSYTSRFSDSTNSSDSTSSSQASEKGKNNKGRLFFLRCLSTSSSQASEQGENNTGLSLFLWCFST